MYHGEEGAKESEEYFVSTFQQKNIPDELLEIGFPYTEGLIEHGLVSSKSDLRRLLEAGSVHDLEADTKLEAIPDVPVATPLKLRIGKKRFVQLMP